MSSASFTLATTITEITIIAIGFIGNLLTIIIFLRKTFRNNSISTYCISLAAVECLAIFQMINDIGYIANNAYIINQTELGCKFFSMNGMLITIIPPYIMVAFSIDKLLSMRTNSIAIIKKKWFQWSIVAAIVIFNTALYICYPILIKRSEIFPGYFICNPTTIGFFQIFIIVTIFETSLIPFLILTTVSILTIRALFKSRNSVERTGNLSKDRKSRDRRFAISSVTFNTMYIVLQMPSAVYFTLVAFYSYYDAYYFAGANLLFYLNCSLGFVIHIVTNSLFRREFLILFRLDNRIGTTSSNNTSRANIAIRLN
jgi:hypothetical protein